MAPTPPPLHLVASTPAELTITLNARTLAALEVLANTGETAVDVMGHLARRVCDGVYRPRSWERPWVVHAFGDAWLARLEQDPDAEHRVRPKPGP